MDLSHLEWATPWGASVLLAPILLAWLAHRRRLKLASWAEPHLLPWAVAASAANAHRGWRSHAAWPAWLLLALAAAGPRLPLPDDSGRDPAAVPHVVSVLAVLDVSASMAAGDIAPDRLTRARLELADLARRLKGERLGLLLYAGEAGLLLPPTADAGLILRALDQVEPGLIETPGSNVAAALALAAEVLGREKPASRAVLLITDAEADSLGGAAGEAVRAAVQKLAAAGMPLYVLAVSSRAGAAVPLPDGAYAERDGRQVVSRPALDAYADLARSSGGALVEVSDGDADWRQLYDGGLARLPGDEPAAATVRAWRSLHTLPLAGALLLFMLAWLPRAATAAALVLALLLPPRDAFADGREFEAWQAYRGGNYAEAARRYGGIAGYAGQMGAGAASWKLGDYAAAARHFGAALLLAGNGRERMDALYNLGNAHFALARWQTAAEAYRAVLQARPGDARAGRNLAEAERQLAMRRHAPVKTDLYGRRGTLAEGEVNVDWDKESALPEFEPPEDSLLVERGHAAGARLQSGQGGGTQAAPDARRLQSGLAKLERLEARPRTLLKGLLRQDRAHAAQEPELAPW